MSKPKRRAGRPGTGRDGQALGKGRALRLDVATEQKLDGLAVSDFGGNWALAARTMLEMGLRTYLDAKFAAAGPLTVDDDD